MAVDERYEFPKGLSEVLANPALMNNLNDPAAR
jgi:hypothetical protein